MEFTFTLEWEVLESGRRRVWLYCELPDAYFAVHASDGDDTGKLAVEWRGVRYEIEIYAITSTETPEDDAAFVYIETPRLPHVPAPLLKIVGGREHAVIKWHQRETVWRWSSAYYRPLA